MPHCRIRPGRVVSFLCLAPLTLLTVACGVVTNVTPSACSNPPGASVSYDITYQSIGPDSTNGRVMISIDVPALWTLTAATYEVSGVPAGAATQAASDPVCADVPQGPVRPGYQRLYFVQDFPTFTGGSEGVLHVTFDTGATPLGAYYPQFYGAGRSDADPEPEGCIAPGTSLRYVIGTETDINFTVASVFNADVIVNEIAGTIDPTQLSVGDPAALPTPDNNAFPTQSVAELLDLNVPAGLPDDGNFASPSPCFPPAQLEYSNDDNGNNSRRSDNVPDTFTFPVPANPYSEVHLYGTFGGPTPDQGPPGPGAVDSTPVAVTLTYSDSTTVVTNVDFRHWIGAPGSPVFSLQSIDTYPLVFARDAIEPTDVAADGFTYTGQDNRSIWAVPVPTDRTKQLISVGLTRLDPAGVFNFFGATGVLIDPVDVSITKARTSAGILTAGTDATYTLTLGNAGPVTASGVTVQDVLPAQLQFVSATASQGSCTQAAGTVNCNIGSVAMGATPTVTIVARPVVAGPITNTATVATTSSDTDPTNNSSTLTESAAPAPGADLAITKVRQGSSVVTPGSDVTFQITASNAGPAAATNVVVNDPVPANSSFQSATPSQGTCALAASTVTCNLGSMASGATATIAVVFRATAAGTLTNTATIQADQTDAVPGNNSATAGPIPVQDPADIPTLSMLALFALAVAMMLAGVHRLSS